MILIKFQRNITYQENRDMSLKSLENFIKENGKNKTIELLKKHVTITEKINGHRVYCKKEKNGNILFYSKKKRTPLNLLDRLLSDLYEPFIKHIITKKDKLQVGGEYGFYLINNPVDIIYTKTPLNNLILTNIPLNSTKTCIETAIELEVSYTPPTFQGILNNDIIELIISYVSNKEKEISLLRFFNEIFKKECSILADNDDTIEGFVFDFNEAGIYKLSDKKFKKKEYSKLNTATYELLLIEIFDFVKKQDFSTVKITSSNEYMKRAEFIFEMYNRFVDYHKNKGDLDNLLLNPPEFIRTKGKINKKYICSNKQTYDYLSDEKMEYLLRVFITSLKDIQKPRGIITAQMTEEYNYLILKITEFIKKSNKLLDYKDFKKFTN